ncbi:hypothetical protein VTL71DRAFT_6482 [Oculimacula yallundae]|uniref:Uncharacterized protein n=1 Tax=Oculimacula yallundae TaxID=86028 RepID=A0ABR4BX47_9HELO
MHDHLKKQQGNVSGATDSKTTRTTQKPVIANPAAEQYDEFYSGAIPSAPTDASSAPTKLDAQFTIPSDPETVDRPTERVPSPFPESPAPPTDSMIPSSSATALIEAPSTHQAIENRSVEAIPRTFEVETPVSDPTIIGSSGVSTGTLDLSQQQRTPPQEEEGVHVADTIQVSSAEEQVPFANTAQKSANEKSTSEGTSQTREEPTTNSQDSSGNTVLAGKDVQNEMTSAFLEGDSIRAANNEAIRANSKPQQPKVKLYSTGEDEEKPALDAEEFKFEGVRTQTAIPNLINDITGDRKKAMRDTFAVVVSRAEIENVRDELSTIKTKHAAEMAREIVKLKDNMQVEIQEKVREATDVFQTAILEEGKCQRLEAELKLERNEIVRLTQNHHSRAEELKIQGDKLLAEYEKNNRLEDLKAMTEKQILGYIQEISAKDTLVQDKDRQIEYLTNTIQSSEDSDLANQLEDALDDAYRAKVVREMLIEDRDMSYQAYESRISAMQADSKDLREALNSANREVVELKSKQKAMKEAASQFSKAISDIHGSD